jgi:hypothetical protein
MWGGYTSNLKDFAKQNQALDLWRFRGLGFNMMCAQVESSSKKFSRFNDSWRFGFGVPMLELVNCHKLQSLIFLCCSHNSQCTLGWTSCLLFAPLILNCSPQGCSSIPSSILKTWVVKLPCVVEFVVGSNSKVSKMKCKVCNYIERCNKLLWP